MMKRPALVLAFFVLTFLAPVHSGFAAEPIAGPESGAPAAAGQDAGAPAGGPVQTVIDALTGKFGWFPKILSIFVFVMGLLRTVFKPVMSWLEARVKETADEADDRKLEAFERGPVFKALCWLLDFSASIKVGAQKK